MGAFEQATLIVSQVNMFSSNELIDEITTDSLKYLLLPYFLGKLSMKLQRKDREEVLNLAEIYFKDFLKRCEEYDLCEIKKDVTTKNNVDQNELAELMQAANSRNAKIAQFYHKKELDEYIKKMRIAVRNQTVDDEVRRDFFIRLIQKSIIDAREELDSLKLEKQVLEMHKMHMNKQNEEHESSSGNRNPLHKHTQQKRTPLQPFIITRDATQKAVFGLGYPSLPVLTVNEFYDQRVRDGVFPDEHKIAQMNLAQAEAALQDPEEKEDAERAILEEQIENDDPENLARMRRMDEFHDVVRRGDGNRHNRS